MKVSTNAGGIDKIDKVFVRKDLKKINDSDGENIHENVSTEDKVEISSPTFNIDALQAAAMKFPNVRPEKVAEIKTRIDNGTYIISHEELAERLIEDGLMA